MDEVTDYKRATEETGTLHLLASKLTPISQAILEATGRTPTIQNLIDIETSQFNRGDVLMKVIDSLTRKHWALDHSTAVNIAASKIFGATRTLKNHSKSKYGPLMVEHLRVQEDATIILPDSEITRIKEHCTVPVTAKGRAVIDFLTSYTKKWNEQPEETEQPNEQLKGTTRFVKMWLKELAAIMKDAPDLDWTLTVTARPDTELRCLPFPDLCRLEGQTLLFNDYEVALKYQ